MKKQPTVDQQLDAFLTEWIATRVKLAEKYRLRAERWASSPGMSFPLATDLRKVKHYEHEIKMLRELRARSIT